MDLVNHTPVPALLTCTEIPDVHNRPMRLAVIVAKATFIVVDHATSLDHDRPIPVLTAEVFTPLGPLPRDTIVVHPDDAGVDVMVVGHAWSRLPTDYLDVTLRIGPVCSRLRVAGDRKWLHTSAGCVLSAPVPFERMPLSWSRAFGGTNETWLDSQSVVPLAHPINPLGLGFDAWAMARGMREQHQFPEGFPRVEGERFAPNVENPDALVRNSDDSPEPYCWAPVPMEVGLRTKPVRRFSFAHPSLQKLPVGPGTQIEMTHAERGTLSFVFPSLRLEADYEIGDRNGTLPLRATQLLLLADERRFTVTLQVAFRFASVDGTSRSIRLRVV